MTTEVKDVVEKLRAVIDWLLRSRLVGHEVTAVHSAEAAKEAVDEIARLSARATAAEGRVALLEEALEPFARCTDEWWGFLDNLGQPLPDSDGPGWVYLTLGDFRRARLAKGRQS